MKIELREIAVADLVQDFVDNAEAGVRAYSGKLDIRPPYQREFIYKDKQRRAVIDSVRKNFPLNTMYWAVHGDDTYEIIDGQQRTLSICQYVNRDFLVDGLSFLNLKAEEQQQILNYKVMVYFCYGSDSENLDWFRTINISGTELTDQELRNAVYAGPWTADAKRYFSKTGCPAQALASDYLRGAPIRQDYLETAIKWKADGDVEQYMSRHQHDSNATQLWQHFQKVVGWVKATFPEYRREMKGVDWGTLYKENKDKELDTDKLEKQVAELMQDDDVERKPGIYHYVMDGETRNLNIRTFSANMRREAYERQSGICVKCKNLFQLDEMEADHIRPWQEGGKTNAENCQMLCREDNRRKSDK
jgi:hypothetical protein